MDKGFARSSGDEKYSISHLVDFSNDVLNVAFSLQHCMYIKVIS